MTNTLSIWLFALIACLLALDWYLADWGASLFLARKGLVLIEYLASGADFC